MAKGRIIEAVTAERRAKLLALRRQGVRYDDPRIMNLGYANAGAARKDLTRALQHHHDEEAAEASVYRQQENERLDAELERLQELEEAARQVLTNRHILVNNGRVILHPDTEQPMEDDGPVLQAIDRLVKIEDARRRNGERRASLNGFNAPVQTEVSGPAGGPLSVSTADPEKLAAIMAATSRLGAPSPENTATSTPADDSGEETEG
ncbi:hypothetical protein [Streptomyces sp. SP18CM02]|uniref:hypothetical protein n=1 Tax=Streptomyces sp. SP18CM02 TaxID=2758571 RepID=UPI00168ADF06|nr:hypothetical protein [Streptomyces sp. SP18CM02]MBD3550877.1 hypothetical protein [Streptomyces sp. SP18CM02]